MSVLRHRRLVHAGRASAVGLILLAACYSYVPVPLESVPVGSSVRAYLSPGAAGSLGERVGMDARTLSGRLTESSPQQVVLLVRSPMPVSPAGSSALFQRVDVAVPDVVRVDIRVFNKLRTGGLVAALLGAATVWTVQAFRSGRGGSVPGNPNPVE